jgi:hypothetical protein
MKYLILLLFPILAQASELELACNLERSKAEVTASNLAAPAAYGTLGQDPITTSKSAIAGVSQSLSGRSQASKIREAAGAKCDALRASLELDEFGRWSQQQVQRDGAIAELRIVEQAIALAKSNIAQLDEQLAAHTITVNQHTAARGSLVFLEDRQAELLRELSIASKTPPVSNAQNLLSVSRIAEARAASLTAQAQADAGWDISVQAGVRQPLDGGKARTYSNITFRWSFGSSNSRAAAQAVGEYTEALLSVQQGGYTQIVVRQQETLRNLIQAETLAAATAARQEEHLRQVHGTVSGVDSTLALNTIRVIDLQLKTLEASRVGAETRLTGYKALLEKIS